MLTELDSPSLLEGLTLPMAPTISATTHHLSWSPRRPPTSEAGLPPCHHGALKASTAELGTSQSFRKEGLVLICFPLIILLSYRLPVFLLRTSHNVSLAYFSNKVLTLFV